MTIRVLDVETTGLNPATDAICEVATIDLVEEGERNWLRGRSWSTLVKPAHPIPPQASAVHHITTADVAAAPAWEGVRPKLLEGLDGPPVLAAHQAKFDRAFVGEFPGARWICSYKLAIRLWPEAPEFKNQTLRYWLGLKLKDEAPPHRAAGDAYVTAAILARAFRDFIITADDMVAISSEPALLPRFHFGKHAMVDLKATDPKGRWLVPTDYLDWVVKNVTDDEDVQFTARCHLHDRQQAQRNRSPVTEPEKPA